VQDANGFTLSMYPNPATNEVTLVFNSGKKANVVINITDVSGATVYHENVGQVLGGSRVVPLTSFTPGVYMVELASGDEKIVQKLVKE
jgi:hypothetical protein